LHVGTGLLALGQVQLLVVIGIVNHLCGLLWRILCTFVTRMQIVRRQVTALRIVRYPVIGLSGESLICRRVNDLREVSLSPDLRGGRALLRGLRVDLLLLHRVVLRAVVYW